MPPSYSERFLNAVRSEITEGSTLFAPLKVIQFEMEPGPLFGEPDGYVADAYLELGWQDRVYGFVVEIKSRTAPSIVRGGIQQLTLFATNEDNRYPLLLVPYLSSRIVGMLERSGLSGIDPNGNYFIQLPELLAIRLDQKNKYKESRDIKRIFSGDSSIVGRFLLSENLVYEQVNDIYEGIQELGGGISLSTVSKVLQGLEEKLIIEKSRSKIRVLQPEKLLDELRKGYRAPRVSKTLKLKLPERREEMEVLLSEELGEDDWVWSGESSAEAYTMTTPARMYSAYTSAPRKALDRLEPWVRRRFYNCELQQTKQAFVYFDRHKHWASPLECYLALSQLDKREREIAQDIEKEILARFT